MEAERLEKPMIFIMENYEKPMKNHGKLLYDVFLEPSSALFEVIWEHKMMIYRIDPHSDSYSYWSGKETKQHYFSTCRYAKSAGTKTMFNQPLVCETASSGVNLLVVHQLLTQHHFTVPMFCETCSCGSHLGVGIRNDLAVWCAWHGITWNQLQKGPSMTKLI